mgnify:CR=1 FL=1
MKDFWKMFLAALLAIIVGSIVTGLLSFLFFIFTMAQIASFSSLQGESEYVVPNHSVLRLDFTEVKEVTYRNPWDSYLNDSGNGQAVSLTQLLNAIDNAKKNPKIDGIYLTASAPVAGMASLSEIRQRLLDFRKSGKFVVAYADNYAQAGYYLASAADELYLNPQGAVDLHGIASTTLFYKQTLAKLGVEMNVFKVGTYKGAVEPYTNTQLSDANREQMNSFTQALWSEILKDISVSRNIEATALNAMVDEAPLFYTAKEYMQNKLVDTVLYSREMKGVLNSYLDQDEDESISFVSVGEMNRARAISRNRDIDGLVKVIYAEGNIIDGDDGFSGYGNINRTLASELIRVAEDDDIDAVVMRVNSPGGSAFVSDVIWDAVEYVKSRKPIVISMGDYAASGGYYISCAANYIYAEPGTITGSIGIFGMFPSFAGTAEKIALTYDGVKTNQYADLGNALRPLTDGEKALFQKMVEQGYDTFITRVANGRNLSKAMVDSIGQGRVWTGEQALERKLVDAMGGLDDAIVKAAALAKMTNYKVVYNDRAELSWKKMLRSFGISTTRATLNEFFTNDEIEAVRRARLLRSMTGAQAIIPYMVNF